jgi:methanogenic corrinoid protein MtbC1
LEELANSIAELDPAEKVKRLLSSILSQGSSTASEITEKGIRRGMEQVGQKYEAGEYFLSELLYAGSLVTELSQILAPVMKNEQLESKGLIALGTVKGDIHDIGKNIFKMLAQSAGFEVNDLGVDVEPSVFADEVRKSSPQVLALSALLTTSLAEMKNTVDNLTASGVRSKVKVLLGGNAVTKEFGREIGAEGAAHDAVEGLEMCRLWLHS